MESESVNCLKELDNIHAAGQDATFCIITPSREQNPDPDFVPPELRELISAGVSHLGLDIGDSIVVTREAMVASPHLRDLLDGFFNGVFDVFLLREMSNFPAKKEAWDKARMQIRAMLEFSDPAAFLHISGDIASSKGLKRMLSSDLPRRSANIYGFESGLIFAITPDDVNDSRKRFMIEIGCTKALSSEKINIHRIEVGSDLYRRLSDSLSIHHIVEHLGKDHMPDNISRIEGGGLVLDYYPGSEERAII